MMMNSTVGVASGDVFRYSYTCYFDSNDPHAVPPASFSWINQTDYFMVNVTGVSGSSVNFETMLRGLNGTDSIGVCSMNVGTGMASISGYGGPSGANNFYFMARNVGMMGRMFPSSNNSPTINDTLMMSYAGGQRLTNHFTTSTTENGMMVNSDFYFDQATGMMVEWRQETIQTNGNLQDQQHPNDEDNLVFRLGSSGVSIIHFSFSLYRHCICFSISCGENCEVQTDSPNNI